MFAEGRKPRPAGGTRSPLSGRTIRRLLDGAFLLLVLLLIGWLLLAAEVTGGNGIPASTILLLSAGSYVVASTATRQHSWVIPAIVAIATVGLVFVDRDVLLTGPYNAPLGYSNAAGSLFLIAAGAGLMVVARSRVPGIRWIAGLSVLLFSTLPWLNRTLSASVLVICLPLALLAVSDRAVRFVVATAAAFSALAFAAVLILGSTYDGASVAPWLQTSLSERRVMLWSDALHLIGANRVVGVGPGLFPLNSPTALLHSDTIWPHNELLHLGAEAGLIALFLMLGILGVAFARLWFAPLSVATAVAAATLGAVVVQANIDYILHFPAIGVAAAALVGAGANRKRSVAARARG